MGDTALLMTIITIAASALGLIITLLLLYLVIAERLGTVSSWGIPHFS